MLARADRVVLLRGFPVPTIRLNLQQVIIDAGIDTGCQITLVTPDAARLLEIDVAQAHRWDRLAGVGLSQPVPAVTIGQLVNGGVTISSVEAYIFLIPAALKVEMLVGLNVLRRFRVTFEFDTDTLVLRSMS